MDKKGKERLQELKQHGSRLFPFNIYPCTIPGDFPTVALHWQKSMEVIYVKKGCGQVQLGMVSGNAEEGDIFVIPPGTLHALRSLRGYGMEYENIIFEVDFLGGGAADICAQEYLVPLQTGSLLRPVRISRGENDYEAFAKCLRQAEELCGSRIEGYELGVKAAMLQFVWLLVRRFPKRPHAETEDIRRLKEILQCVEQEYMRDLTIPVMADLCGCSESHFMRWFKKMTGSSFTAYLNERRLAAAAEMLRRSDEKILTLAQSVGFRNLSNFNRQFLARYGMTPGEYRKIGERGIKRNGKK